MILKGSQNCITLCDPFRVGFESTLLIRGRCPRLFHPSLSRLEENLRFQDRPAKRSGRA
jgi:hypothetical protein